jgi:hypothetical protein
MPEWSFKAFGVAVGSELPVQGAQRIPPPGGAHVLLTRAEAAELDEAWDQGVSVLERRLPDGSLGMRVERGEEGDYRVSAPAHGDFLISAEGTHVRCAPADGPAWRWQRPLLGQVLPLAATLQGFELLHASAVDLDGRAIAFTGRSGAGKTSLVTQLVAGGAPLVTDDVLSLECALDGVLAHPGARMANIASEQLEPLSPSARARLGSVVGRSDKLHVEPASMTEEALPLKALYFIDRRLEVEGVTFEPVDPVDPQLLLATTFMPHVVTPRRLMTQLHTCAEIARHVKTFQLRASWTVPAAGLAEAVRLHAAQLAA